MAEMEEKEWVASVNKWNAEVDRREWMGGVEKAVVNPVRARAVPLLPTWKLGEQHAMGVVLGVEDLEVTGPTATWVRKHYRTLTLLTKCESSLLGSFAHRHPRMMLTAKPWLLGSPSAWMAKSGG
jgi:hypothetical protein